MNTAAHPSDDLAQKTTVSEKNHIGNNAMSSGFPSSQSQLPSLVDNVLGQLQSQFEHMSNEILGKIDEMGSRMDELEKVLGNLLEQSNDITTERKKNVPSSHNEESA